MKRQTKLPVLGADERNDGCPSAVSVEAELHRELMELGAWLVTQGLDPRSNAAHAEAGSRDQLYCHYGYFVGMKHALSMLTTHGAIVH